MQAPMTVAQVHAWAAEQIAAGHGAAPVVLQRVVEGQAYVQPLRFTMGPRLGQPHGAPAVCFRLDRRPAARRRSGHTATAALVLVVTSRTVGAGTPARRL